MSCGKRADRRMWNAEIFCVPTKGFFRWGGQSLEWEQLCRRRRQRRRRWTLEIYRNLHTFANFWWLYLYIQSCLTDTHCYCGLLVEESGSLVGEVVEAASQWKVSRCTISPLHCWYPLQCQCAILWAAHSCSTVSPPQHCSVACCALYYCCYAVLLHYLCAAVLRTEDWRGKCIFAESRWNRPLSKLASQHRENQDGGSLRERLIAYGSHHWDRASRHWEEKYITVQTGALKPKSLCEKWSYMGSRSPPP